MSVFILSSDLSMSSQLELKSLVFFQKLIKVVARVNLKITKDYLL